MKVVAICKALDMSLVDLLCDEEDKKNTFLTVDHAFDDQTIINHIENSSVETIRHAQDGKLYLYDILRIKKETSNSLGE